MFGDMQILRSCLAVCITIWEAKRHEPQDDWLRLVRDAGLYLESDKLIQVHKRMSKLIPLERVSTMIAMET